jgi:hypothetical protein
MLLQFPHRHCRTPSNPNKDASALSPASDSAAEKIRYLSDGIRPRRRQLLTAGSVTPHNSDTREVPPSASITASTVVSIEADYSRSVNMSTLHALALVTDCEFLPNYVVSTTRDDIAARLRMLPEALGINAAELCRRIKCAPNRWSAYIKPDGKREITLAVANRLCDEFKLTLDWIYRNDASGLQDRLIRKLREAA